MFKYLVFYFYERDMHTDGHGFVEITLPRKVNSAKDIKDIQERIKTNRNYLSVCITGYNLINEN